MIFSINFSIAFSVFFICFIYIFSLGNTITVYMVTIKQIFYENITTALDISEYVYLLYIHQYSICLTLHYLTRYKVMLAREFRVDQADIVISLEQVTISKRTIMNEGMHPSVSFIKLLF